jgi:hypothetical protein
VIQAIIKIYTTVQFFLQKINEILDVVESIVNSIAAIAAGAIASAANFVERTMARTIPVVLDFLARFIGLGDVGAQVQSTIRGIQASVDQMLDRAVDWIKNQARNLASRALGGDPNAPPEQRVRSAVAEAKRAVERFSGQRVGAVVLTPLLAAIRLRHRLTALEVVPRGDFWAIRATINPVFEDGTTIQRIPEGVPSEWPSGSEGDPIPIKWFKPASGFYPTIRYRGGAERTPRQGIRLRAVARTAERELKVADENFMTLDQKVRRQARPDDPVKREIRGHLNNLLNNPDRHDDQIFFAGSGDYAVDHLRDLTWKGRDRDDNLWPLAADKNDAINASHNQQVRVREGTTVRTNAAYMFADKVFIIKKIADTPPRSKDDHRTTRDHPINSGEGDIPKRST